MSEDWLRPITKPLPGPVPSEEKQMDRDELEHVANNHPDPLKGCKLCAAARWMR